MNGASLLIKWRLNINFLPTYNKKEKHYKEALFVAKKIMKLAISAETTVLTSPTVQRFFSEAASTIEGEGELIIPVEDFWDDTGEAATSLPTLAANNSYLNVYVNGVLQMQDLVTYTPGVAEEGQLKITVPAGSKIQQSTPIVLVITNFAPTGQTTIES